MKHFARARLAARYLTQLPFRWRPPYRSLVMSTKFTTLLNDGSSLPRLAFGTGSALFAKDATEHVRMAIENGFTHLDGAQSYDNEQSLGAGIRASGKPRSDLYILTKLKTPDPGQTVKGLLKESLAKLGLDHVDMFLIHSPFWCRDRGNLKQVWKDMEEVQKEGLTKSIGVSNFNEDDLKVVLDGATVVPAVNQVSSQSVMSTVLR
jgi:diketogulonate reductase-like aldo/keto reductase